MATERQIAANRANAKKSTGPKSEEGRSVSSMNSLKFGIFASQIVLPGEDPDQLSQLHDAFVESLKPEGAFESALVEQIASTFWRLQRIPRIEAAIVKWTAYCDENSGLNLKTIPRYSEWKDEEPAPEPQDINARTLHHLAVRSGEHMSKLTRREMAHLSQLRQLTAELTSLQHARKADEEDDKEADDADE